jgi:hypothetical protein
MASGLGAFRSRSKADDFAAKNKGEVRTFQQLLSGEVSPEQHAHRRSTRMRGAACGCGQAM